MSKETQKRPSGGARAVKKKRAERKAKRARSAQGADPQGEWLATVDAAGEPPAAPDAAHEWLGKIAVLIVRATIRDVGLPPEQMRRDAMKQIEQAQKVIGSAKLAAELRELYEALKDGKDAAHLDRGDGEVRPSEADLS